MSLCTRITTTLFLSLALIACGGDQAEHAGDGEAAHENGPDFDHESEAETTGPHGGALAVVGDSAARLEALHDDVLGQVTIYILDAEDGMLTLDQAPVLNLVTDEGSLQLKPTQIGGAWVFESDDLLDEPEKARFRIALTGKNWTVAMPCSHGHEHGADCDHESEADEHAGHEHGDEHGEGHDDDEHGHHAEDGDGHDGDAGHAADHEDGDEDGEGHDDEHAGHEHGEGHDDK